MRFRCFFIKIINWGDNFSFNVVVADLLLLSNSNVMNT